jgi:hypothetical protein
VPIFIGRGAPLHARARYHALPAAAPASRMIPASCGSPGREPRNPARDVGPEILVLRSEPANERRLLVPVCTDNLNTGIMVMKSTQDGV